MLKAERHDAVVEVVNDRGVATVADIANLLGVSEMTIRRDLTELAGAGRLIRIHGGAKSMADTSTITIPRELSHAEKGTVNAEEKESIARVAAGLITLGTTIFLGPGTTIQTLAAALPVGIRVVTNSLPVMDALRDREGIELCAIGGSYRHTTGAFVGPMADAALSVIGIDAAFISANGILGQAISTANEPEGTIQRTAFDRAERRYLLADSSKLGRRDFYTFYSLDDVDALITDVQIPEDVRSTLEEHTNIICSS